MGLTTGIKEPDVNTPPQRSIPWMVLFPGCLGGDKEDTV